MDQQQIKACIDAMTASDLAEMEFSHDGWSLRLVRRPLGAAFSPAAAAPASAVRREPGVAAPPAAAVPFAAAPSSDSPAAVLAAPLYGVVHLSPGPGEPPFASAGQAVAAGQVLCVIEAMKVFNQIVAERDATVAQVLVETGQEVEAGQPLLRFA